ncbi:MAG: methylenetetrahydrofolate--tRNA-(uracil(54)-C(5))-methyltransferase (FADH(2)-oxidizing) TrmFO [bacterium]
MDKMVTVLGGGFAGVEAAWAVAQRGVRVRLYEMRPHKMTPAHKSGNLGELVCSNSFKSDQPTSPAGHLKWEMEQLGSLVIPTARKHAVPAGQALAVERDAFSAELTERIESHPLIELIREEVTCLPTERPLIVATGPLTSESLSSEIAKLAGHEYLYFYDAVSPTVDASTINYDRVFKQSRYDKGEGDDYINCPFNKEEYQAFYQALVSAELTPLRDFEDPKFFEGCLPLEEIACRGERSMSFGPFKPVGLTDPHTGRRPWAVMQLRPEDKQGRLYSLVACQTRMTWPEQKRVFHLVPGLENAEFVRLGVIHRNTYIDSPRLLLPTLQYKEEPTMFFAGQLVGVEGYIESAAAGLMAGINAARLVSGKEAVTLPEQTVLGSLLAYITTVPDKHFAPMNANWGLLPEEGTHTKDKTLRREKKLQSARTAFENFMQELP